MELIPPCGVLRTMQRQNKNYKEKQNEEINSIIAKEILKQREARACLRLDKPIYISKWVKK